MALSRRSFSLLPAACFASQAYGQSEFKGEGGKVRVASFPGGNDYPFWAIAKLGLDRKYGFELENVSVQPGGAALTGNAWLREHTIRCAALRPPTGAL